MGLAKEGILWGFLKPRSVRGYWLPPTPVPPVALRRSQSKRTLAECPLTVSLRTGCGGPLRIVSVEREGGQMGKDR